MNNGLGLFKEVLSGKWKILLIYHIHSGIRRPGELQRKIPNADRRVLTNQLGELVKHELVSKKVYSDLPLKVEYELTALGESILPLICQINQWGEDHREQIEKVSAITQDKA